MGMENGQFGGDALGMDEMNTSPIPFSCIDEDIYQHPDLLIGRSISSPGWLAFLNHEPCWLRTMAFTGNLLAYYSGRAASPDRATGKPSWTLEASIGALGQWSMSRSTLLQPRQSEARIGTPTDVWKRSNVFPPPGLSIEDNFSKYGDEVPGREHVAILGNVSNSRTILICSGKPASGPIRIEEAV